MRCHSNLTAFMMSDNWKAIHWDTTEHPLFSWLVPRIKPFHKWGMRGCRIGERGGMAFVELIQRDALDEDDQCGLVVDLSVNGIGFWGSMAI